MKTIITKAPHSSIEINMFRRSNNLYVNIDKEQYLFNIQEIIKLEDLDKRPVSACLCDDKGKGGHAIDCDFYDSPSEA